MKLLMEFQLLLLASFMHTSILVTGLIKKPSTSISPYTGNKRGNYIKIETSFTFLCHSSLKSRADSAIDFTSADINKNNDLRSIEVKRRKGKVSNVSKYIS